MKCLEIADKNCSTERIFNINKVYYFIKVEQ